MPQDLQRPVGDDLVGVHVGRGAGAALDHVDHELVVQLARLDLAAGFDDGVGPRAVQQAQIVIGARRRLLDLGERADQFRVVRDGCAGDGEILDRTQGMDAVIGIGGNFAVAQQVMLGAGDGCGHLDCFTPICVSPVLAGRRYRSNARAIFRTVADERYLFDFIDDFISAEAGAFGFPDGLSDSVRKTERLHE